MPHAWNLEIKSKVLLNFQSAIEEDVDEPTPNPNSDISPDASPPPYHGIQGENIAGLVFPGFRLYTTFYFIKLILICRKGVGWIDCWMQFPFFNLSRPFYPLLIRHIRKVAFKVCETFILNLRESRAFGAPLLATFDSLLKFLCTPFFAV